MSKAKLLQAKALIRQKRYDDARALLITVDHPTADKWLARLSRVAPTSRPDYTNKLVIVIVLYFALFLPGLIAHGIWVNQAMQDDRRYDHVPGAMPLIQLWWVVLGLLAMGMIGFIVAALTGGF